MLEWVGQRGERKCVEGRNVGGVWWTVGVGGQWEWVEGGGGGVREDVRGWGRGGERGCVEGHRVGDVWQEQGTGTGTGRG